MKVMLNCGMGMYEEKGEFPLGDLNITLLNMPKINAEMRYIAELNGKEIYRKNVSVMDNELTIPKDLLGVGVFSSCVYEYIGGKPVQEFKIENLVISDIHSTLFANPEVAKMQKEIESLQKKIEVLESYADKAENEINRLKRLVNNLIDFAFDDYSKNVYLDGGSKDEFLKKYNLGE